MSGGDFRDCPGRSSLIAWMRIGHVAGVVGVGAQVLRGEPAAGGFLLAMVVCGLGIAVLDQWASRTYLRQLNGGIVLLKVALVFGLAAFGAFGAPAFWGLLVVSVAIAHAPGRWRHKRLG